MAQKQTAHRIEIEKIVITSREKQSQKGQYFAFIIAILLILLSGVALFLDYPKIAALIAGGTITSTITLFLKSKHIQKPQHNEKQI